MRPKYDLSKLTTPFRCCPLTVLYSITSHFRGHLHMTRCFIDTFYILTGKGPGDRKMTRPGVFEWTMEDQEKLIAPYLEKCVIVEEPKTSCAMDHAYACDCGATQ